MYTKTSSLLLPDLEAAKLCQRSYRELTLQGFNRQQELLYLELEHHRVVVFRGSDEFADWVDIDFNYRPATIHSGMKTTAGFLSAFTSIYYPLQELLHSQSTQKPLWTVGHSLGGAVAGIAADVFEADGYISFGCPRFACPAYAEYLGNKLKYEKRIAFWNDPVQYTGNLFRYRHVCPVTWLKPDIWCPPLLHLIKHYVRVLEYEQ